MKHTKGAKDAKRGKLFSKISLEIISSIRAGGADAAINGRLAAALSKAKHAMMPKDSIDAAVKKVNLLKSLLIIKMHVDFDYNRRYPSHQAIPLRMSYMKVMDLAE